MPNDERQKKPFSHQKPRRISQPKVDYAREEEAMAAGSTTSYSHQSDYAAKAPGPFAQSSYRRSRMQEEKFKKNLQYGQYLSVPKGSRDLFGQNPSAPVSRKLIAAIIILAVIVVLVLAILLLSVTP